MWKLCRVSLFANGGGRWRWLRLFPNKYHELLTVLKRSRRGRQGSAASEKIQFVPVWVARANANDDEDEEEDVEDGKVPSSRTCWSRKWVTCALALSMAVLLLDSLTSANVPARVSIDGSSCVTVRFAFFTSAAAAYRLPPPTTLHLRRLTFNFN